jgi:hypothetical protein
MAKGAKREMHTVKFWLEPALWTFPQISQKISKKILNSIKNESEINISILILVEGSEK